MTARDRANRWWWYGRLGKDLYEATKGLDRILVRTQVSKTQMSGFVSPGMIFDQRLVVFALRSFAAYAVLDSSLHYWWTLLYGSSLRTDAVYTPSDCFETFPFPDGVLKGGDDGLENVGESYYKFRQSIMAARNEGLTSLYNRFHDPDEIAGDIESLRQRHADLDRAVLAAYRMAAFPLEHDFEETPLGFRFCPSRESRRRVLESLLKLNHDRYEQEVFAGLHEKSSTRKAQVGSEVAADLFD